MLADLPGAVVSLVLVCHRSSLVESILVAAQQTKRGSFRVIVVDSRPGVEGRQLADTLSAEGIPCTYVLLTAISYIMRVRTPRLLVEFPNARLGDMVLQSHRPSRMLEECKHEVNYS